MSHQTDLAQLYTAFFNRAPDAAGLTYWVDKLAAGTMSLEAIAKNWVDLQPEGQSKYPDGLSSNDFIEAIYTNVLSRSADAEGLQYWQGQLDSGAISRDVFVAAIISGAHANTSAQGLLDAKLLTNKADVGLAFANKGLNDTSLAAKVLTTVTASDDSLSITLSLIKLVPASASEQTPELLTRLSDTLGKVEALISGAPSEVHDLATYLSTVSASAGSTTDLNALLTKVGEVTTAALTDPTALDNPADLANSDVIATTPSTGGGTTPPSTPPALTATVTDHILKLAGAGTAPVVVDLIKQTVTVDGKLVTVTGADSIIFVGVDASTYTQANVTAVGSIKQILAHNDTYNLDPTFIGVDSREIMDEGWRLLTWDLAGVDKVSVRDEGGFENAHTLSLEEHDRLIALTTTDTWKYDIRDTVAKINAGDSQILQGAEFFKVADSLANLSSPDATDAIDLAGGEYIVLDTWQNISSELPPGEVSIGADSIIVHDTLAGVQAAIFGDLINPGLSEYEIEDTAANLLAGYNLNLTLFKNAGSLLVTGNAAGELTLQQRLDLGEVTDDDFWSYSIKDSTENILAYAGSYQASFLKDASSVTAIANSEADVLDGDISAHSIVLAFNQLNDAPTFTFDTDGYSFTGTPDTFLHFNAPNEDKVDLTAYGLTGQDILSLIEGPTTVADGRFAMLTNVALHGNMVSAASGSDTAGTLILWDADVTAAIQQVGVWLPDQTVDGNAVIIGIV